MSVPRRALMLIVGGVMFIALGCKSLTSERIAALRVKVGEELPQNSTYNNVLVYLDKNGIEHTAYEKANNREELRLLESPGRIDGVIRKIKVGLISTSLIFLFDDRGRMTSYRIVESVKAP